MTLNSELDEANNTNRVAQEYLSVGQHNPSMQPQDSLAMAS